MAGDGERGDRPGGISRRAFVYAGAAVAAGASLLPALAEAAKKKKRKKGKAAQEPQKAMAGTEVAGPGPVPMRFRVNGRPHEAALEPRATLLDALRGPLNLTGAKEACDRGTCGACTVLLDGKAVYACSVLAIEAQGGRQITTVEGLGRPGRLSGLQASFVAADPAPCGFCAPGLLMAARALLDRNPQPTAEEVDRGLAGNLCRCGAYVGVRQAVLNAAREPDPPEPPEPVEDEAEPEEEGDEGG